MTSIILHHQQWPDPMEAQPYMSYLRTIPKIQMVFLPVIPENSPSLAEVVRPILGPHALRSRLGGRFACLTADCGSGDTGGVHAKQRGGAGLLRREPGGQVQPPSRGGATWRGGAWRPTGCLVDLNAVCPAGLRVAAGARGMPQRVRGFAAARHIRWRLAGRRSIRCISSGSSEYPCGSRQQGMTRLDRF